MSNKSKATKDTPGVSIPPPLHFAAALIGGLLLERVAPTGSLAGIEYKIAGITITIVSVALFIASWFHLAKQRTTIDVYRSTTTLVTTGPFGLSRNPIYVSMSLLTAGIGILRDSWWPAILLPVAMLLVTRLVIKKEEKYLREKFGAPYEEYTSRVRRWL